LTSLFSIQTKEVYASILIFATSMNTLISKILSHPELIARPPVLVDIGASGEIHSKWKKIAPYAICIAFDADSRDFAVTENEQSDYKKLYVFNCIVSDREEQNINFYLTRSPYCSSTLKPANARLKDFIFAPLFEVDKEIQLKNISLAGALQKLNITYVDWFKSDSQGTDLRLFKNLPDAVRDNVLIAEFEPGIIDAYEGEDKMYSVMEYMDKKGYILTNMDVKKVQHISEAALADIFSGAMFSRFARKSVKALPAWAELTYLNRFETGIEAGLREFLLASLFALLQEQYIYALHICIKAQSLHSDPLLAEIITAAQKLLKKDYHRMKFLGTIGEQVWNRIKG
jgi:hypothetical protein